MLKMNVHVHVASKMDLPLFGSLSMSECSCRAMVDDPVASCASLDRGMRGQAVERASKHCNICSSDEMSLWVPDDAPDVLYHFPRLSDLSSCVHVCVCVCVCVCCLLYTSPSPRDATLSRMPSSA